MYKCDYGNKWSEKEGRFDLCGCTNSKAQSETNFHHSVHVMLLQLFLKSNLFLPHQWILGYMSQKAQLHPSGIC